jgi:hypothetical protein
MNPDLIRAQIAGLRATHPELVEDEESWLLALESETDLTETLRAIERKRQETAGLAGGIVYAITQLHERQERFERRETALRAILFKLMQAADLRKVELPEATLSVRNGTPKVIITDETALPDDACRFKREPDKKTIKEWLESGTVMAGATLSNAEPCLSVRVR